MRRQLGKLNTTRLCATLLVVLLGCVLQVSGAAASAGSGPPVNTAAPSLGGKAEEGKTLKIKSGKWSGAKPITYAYSWQLCDAEGEACGSSVAATSNLQMRPEWAGHTLRGTVTATNGAGEATASAESPVVVAKGAPYPTAKPVITGAPAVGHTVQASQGTWSAKKPVTYTYQWLSCDSAGNECHDIAEATEPTFTATAQQAGETLRVRVTASNPFGHTPARSNPTIQVPFAGAATIAAGGDHTCALLKTGQIQCWGNGELGQLGDNAIQDSSQPVNVQGLSDATGVAAGQGATEITAGAEHSCAVLNTGHIDCWGNDNAGQLGNGTTSTSPTSDPVEVEGVNDAVQVVAGYEHSCALLASGHVRCWGFNYHGELGDGTAGGEAATPVEVAGISNATQLSAGWYHTCAALSSGHVDCWGWNLYGQLGNGSSGGQSATPVEAAGIVTATNVAAGYGHTCATLANGRVDCWGANGYGQLGTGNNTSSSTPTEVAGVTDATAIAAGYDHTCALTSSGTGLCWGENDYGQLGNDSTLDSSNPVEVAGLSGAHAISVGYGHSCALLQDGGLRCWGYDYYGQLGDSTHSRGVATAPVAVSGLANISQISTAYVFTCALLTGGTIRCWGYNRNGELGNPTVGSSDTPIEVDGISTATDLSAYYLHACATLAGGTVDCWGYNGWGQLGNGSYNQSSEPTAVSGIHNAAQVATGVADTCALLSNGHVDCWGYNGGGQLGDESSATSSTVPVEVQAITNATKIAYGREFACALLSTGHIECWGANGQGQLGDGNTKNSNVPVEVTGIENATAVTLGSEHACALISDGAMMCWGYNYHGELGTGTTGGYSTSPLEVPGLTDVYAIGAGDYHTCALTVSAGTQCWGEDFFGQLGDGIVGGSNGRPAEVPGIADAAQITGSWGDTCAVESGGIADCWGWSDWGQLGNGETWRTLPTVVTGY